MKKLTQKEREQAVTKGFLEDCLESKEFVTQGFLTDYLDSKEYVTKDFLVDYLDSREYVTKGFLVDYLDSREYVTKNFLVDYLDSKDYATKTDAEQIASRYANLVIEEMTSRIKAIIQDLKSSIMTQEQWLSNHEDRILVLESGRA